MRGECNISPINPNAVTRRLKRRIIPGYEKVIKKNAALHNIS
jgi:hypothetical protein